MIRLSLRSKLIGACAETRAAYERQSAVEDELGAAVPAGEAENDPRWIAFGAIATRRRTWRGRDKIAAIPRLAVDELRAADFSPYPQLRQLLSGTHSPDSRPGRD